MSTFKMIFGLSLFWYHEVEPKPFVIGSRIQVLYVVKSSEYWGISPTGFSLPTFYFYFIFYLSLAV